MHGHKLNLFVISILAGVFSPITQDLTVTAFAKKLRRLADYLEADLVGRHPTVTIDVAQFW